MKPFNPKPRSCPVCGKGYVPLKPMQAVCSPRCAVKKIKQDKAQERAQVKTRKEKAMTRGERIARAQAESYKRMLKGYDVVIELPR